MPRPATVLTCVLLLTTLIACTPLAQQQGTTTGPMLAGTVDAAPTAITIDDDAQWQQIDTAMQLRTLRLSTDSGAALATIVRFDPQAYKVRVKYDVEDPGLVDEWFAALQPLALINGGYFDAQGRPTALVIFDGVRRGESYDGFGGMVVINEQGEFELRSLRQQPFDPNEPLQQAMQSAPMLIQPGGQLSDLEPDDDRSRRSVIARDTQGRILLIAVDAPVLTLPELAQVLKDADLALDAALNLDGGRSTGLYVRTDSASVAINSIERLPLVLVVERS